MHFLQLLSNTINFSRYRIIFELDYCLVLTMLQEYQEFSQLDDTKKNWSFPKNHSHSHAAADIWAKGATRNYNTKPNESMHGMLRWIYRWLTNFKKIEGQVS